MSKYTPGPWKYGELSERILPEGSALPVAECDKRRPEHEANARLIAAAPELLAACKLLLNDMRTGKVSGLAVMRGQEAIAKAES